MFWLSVHTLADVGDVTEDGLLVSFPHHVLQRSSPRRRLHQGRKFGVTIIFLPRTITYGTQKHEQEKKEKNN